MDKSSSSLQKLVIPSVIGLIGVIGIQTSVQAAFLSQYTGYSVFASPDPGTFDNPNVEPIPGTDLGSLQCPFCDSTVSFSVYETEDSNWTDDFGSNFQGAITNLFGGSVDVDVPYVFFYEVVNTDPLIEAEGNLSSYIVSVEEKEDEVNPWLGPSPYTSGGYVDNYRFQNHSFDIFDNPANQPTDPPGGTRVDILPGMGEVCMPGGIADPPQPLGIGGCPGNWKPDVLVDVGPFVEDPDAIDPVALSYTQVTADEAFRNGGAGPITNGMLWQWAPGNEITPNEYSSLLFLTAATEEEFMDALRQVNDIRADDAWLKVNFPWGKTQSPQGEGTDGDVAGLKVTWKTKIPEPSSFLSLLAIGCLSLGLKHKQQQP